MNKKVILILTVSIFLLSASPVAFADDVSYTIDLADIFLKVCDNGLLKVNESYTYNIDGQINGVYREIPLKNNQSIENLEVYADGAYTKVEKTLEEGTLKIKVYLYSDEALQTPVSDKSVVIHYSYDFLNVVKLYEDIGELQYKIIGDDWDTDINNIHAHVEFPEDKKLEYWINPIDIKSSERWDKNTLDINGSVDKGNYLEIRALIPLSEFSNSVYAQKINHDGYDEIVKIQKDYENRINFENNVSTIIAILLILSLIYPIFVYYKYGREPKVDFNQEYVHEPPCDENPMFVDAMFSNKNNIGKVTNNGIQAVIMEMIDDGQIELADKSVDNKSLKLILPKSIKGMDYYKQDIVNLFRPFEKNGVVDLNDIKSLKGYEKKKFGKTIAQIKKDYFREDILPYLKNYFNEEGSDRFLFYSICLIIASGVYMFFLSYFGIPNITYFILDIILITIGFSIYKLTDGIGGSWTKKGMTEYKQWNAFKHFLNDFSLLSQHPPESIAIWNKYLVYATAFGDAKEVKKAMKTIESKDYIEDNDLFNYVDLDGAFLMALALDRVMDSNLSDMGDIGDIGGGSGGGGGGAF